MRFKTIEENIKKSEGQFKKDDIQFKKAEVQFKTQTKCVVILESMIAMSVINHDGKAFYLASTPYEEQIKTV